MSIAALARALGLGLLVLGALPAAAQQPPARAATARPAAPEASIALVKPAAVRAGESALVSGRLTDGWAQPMGAVTLTGVMVARSEAGGASSVRITWTAATLDGAGGPKQALLAEPLSSQLRVTQSEIPAGTALRATGNVAGAATAIAGLAGVALSPETARKLGAPGASAAAGGSAAATAGTTGAAPAPMGGGTVALATSSGVVPAAGEAREASGRAGATVSPGQATGSGFLAAPGPGFAGAGDGAPPAFGLGGSGLASSGQTASGTTSAQAGTSAGQAGGTTTTGTTTTGTTATGTLSSGAGTAAGSVPALAGGAQVVTPASLAPATVTPSSGAPASGGRPARPGNVRIVTPGPATPVATAPSTSAQMTADGCAPRVDLVALTVVAMVQLYDLDRKTGRLERRRGCAPAGAPAALTVDTAACPETVAVSAGIAYEQGRLVWRDTAGAVNEASDCTTRVGLRQFPLVVTLDGCAPRNGWSDGQSLAQARLVYVKDGRTIEVMPCNTTTLPAAYPHVVQQCPDLVVAIGPTMVPSAAGEFQAASTSVDKDPSHRVALKQTRVVLGAPTTSVSPALAQLAGRVILDCQPSTAQNPGLQVATAGCEAQFFANAPAGEALGAWRYFVPASGGSGSGAAAPGQPVEPPAGAAIFVTGCVANVNLSYAISPSFTGWRNDDVVRAAIPIGDLSFFPGTAPVTVQSGIEIGRGTRYALQGTASVETGQTDRFGCDSFRPTDEIRTWLRPDGTTYKERRGPGRATGPVRACS